MEPGLEYNKKEIAQSMSLLWDSLTSGQQEQFVDAMELVRYEKDELFYVEGDSPTNLYYILEGKVKIYKEGFGGRVQILRLLPPNTFFGSRPFFANELYQACAAAQESCLIAQVPMSIVKQMTLENSRLAMLFIESLSRALGLADSYMINLMHKHVRGRLAETLLRLKQYYGTTDDGQTLSLYITREDLACMSNMTTSNAIRTLSNFASEGIVGIEGKRIKLLQEAKLHKISKLG